MNQNRNTEEMSKTRFCWHLDAVCNIVCSFYSELMLERGKNIFLKKRPRREHWKIPVILEKMRDSLARN